jgi:hypothetical protein
MQETDSAPASTTEKTSSTDKRSARRKLTDDQEREVTRLYSQTETPVPDISKQFGIGESSVYRLVERHGGKLRGRTSKTASAAAAKPAGRRAIANATSATTRRGTRTGTRKPAATSTSSPGSATVATAKPRRGAAARQSSARASASATRATRGTRTPRAGRTSASARSAATTRAAAASGSRFKVSFVAEVTVNAGSISDAIRQAEALGATEVTSITRA